MIVIEEVKAVRPCTLLRHLGFFFIATLVLEKWGDTGRHVHADLIHIHFFCEKQLLHSRRYNPRFTFFKPTFCPYLSLVFYSSVPNGRQLLFLLRFFPVVIAYLELVFITEITLYVYFFFDFFRLL